MGFLRSTPGRAKSHHTGGRTYAVGDIHGRLDLFARMIALIRSDVDARPRASPTRLVILGDFIDRGPRSRQVIDVLMQAQATVLKGNHEAALVEAWRGNHDALEMWIDHGGSATLRSFGADVDGVAPDDWQTWMRITRRTVPKAVVTWLDRLPTSLAVDRHYFVHAGIRPGIPLDAQTDADRLWIGDEFTSSKDDHGAVIVHGHSINADGVLLARNRVGVDTGAYRTGRLSAVAIEGEELRVLVAHAE